MWPFNDTKKMSVTISHLKMKIQVQIGGGGKF